MSPLSSSSSSSCSRWCPTAQQVMILEELYRKGVRAPNALQREIIAAHLSLYGHIQPKSVLYWFQNHKARFRFGFRFRFRHQNNTLHHPFFHAHETMKEAEVLVHDLMMICPCCNCKTRPPVTLQLFPLTSTFK